MASAQSIGTVTIDLGLKTAQLEADAGKSARILEQRLAAIQKNANIAAAAITGAFVTGLGAVEEAVRRSIDKMDEFSKAAQKVGVSTEEFSKLAYAAGLSDVATDSLGKALTALNVNLTKAAQGSKEQQQVFQSLGISTKSPMAALNDLADLFQKLPDGQTKAGIAAAVFGKRIGPDLIPLLNGGSESLRELGDEAQRFGVVIDTKTGKAAEDFNDNLTRIKTQAEGFAIQLAANLLPDLLTLEDRFSKVSQQADAVKTVGDAVRYVYDTVQLAVTGVQGLIAQFNVLTASAKLAADSTGPEALKNIATGTYLATIKQDKADLDAATASFSKLRQAAKDTYATLGQKKNDSLFKDVQGGVVQNQFEGVTGGVVEKVTTGDAAKRAQAFLDAQRNATVATKAQSEADRAARKAQSEAEAQAKRVASATLDMQKAIDDASQSLNKTNIPAVDAYNESLVKITEQAAKYAKDGIPQAQIDAFTDKMKALAKATEDASLAQSELSAHQTTLDLQAQAKDAQSAAAGVTGLAVANRDYEKSLEALDKQFESLQISPDDYQAQLQALDTIHQKTISDLQKQADTAGEFAKTAAKGIQDAIADALTGEGFKGGIKGFLGGIADMLRKAAAQIVAADLAKYLFGNYDKTGQVGGLFGGSGSAGGLLSGLLSANGGTASRYEAASIANSEAAVTGASDSGGGWLSSLLGLFGGARANGGPVMAGMGYLVGEHGPEFFQPSSAGSISTNAATRGMSGGGRSINVYVQPTTSRRTADQVASATERKLRVASGRNG